MRDQGVARIYKQVKGKLDAGLPTGYSAAGTVVAVGSEVDGIAIGDRVACAGAGVANHAEFIDVPVNLSVPVPAAAVVRCRGDGDARRDRDAGRAARAADAWAKPSSWSGSAFSGRSPRNCSAPMAAASSAPTSIRAASRPRWKTASISASIPRDGDLVERVIKLTDGVGADAVVITAASASSDILAEAFQACRKKARVVIVGDVGLNMARADIYTKELDVLISCSYGPGRYDPVYEEEGADYPLPYVRWTENRNMGEYLRLLAAGRVRLDNMMQEPFPIDQAEEAYGRLSGEGAKAAAGPAEISAARRRRRDPVLQVSAPAADRRPHQDGAGRRRRVCAGHAPAESAEAQGQVRSAHRRQPHRPVGAAAPPNASASPPPPPTFRPCSTIPRSIWS